MPNGILLWKRKRSQEHIFWTNPHLIGFFLNDILL